MEIFIKERYRTVQIAVLIVLAFVTRSAAQSSTIDTKLAAQYFRQLEQSSDRDGGKTWGLPLYGPIMLVDPRSSNIVANQADLELKPGADLGVLLQQRYGIRVRSSEAAARAAISRYEGDEIVTIETQQEQRRKQQIAEARKKFIDGPVLILSLSPDVNYSYDPNNVIGIDASSTVYPTMRLVDDWGVLTVTNGAWLERDATGHLLRARVSAPADLSARPLKGEGWSLELANGWEVAAGDRAGDVKLRKK